MKKAIIVGMTALLIHILLPVCLLVPLVQSQAETVVLVVEEPEEEKEEEPNIVLGTEQGSLELNLEEYLVGVVLSEMPGSFELEALKAQAVAARTFALRQMEQGKHENIDLCTQSTCCQAWCSVDAWREKLGEAADLYLRRGEQAVQETAGLVLCYDGKLIDAVYFSCSGGTTEDAIAVWGSEVPYLQSVPSLGEENASKYQSVVYVTTSDFQNRMLKENSHVDLTGSPTSWIGNVSLTEGGGVASVVIGGQVFAGTQLRRIFDLNSTKFSVNVQEDGITFYVKGYGHRVGMSQYGANAMAKAGKTFQEILMYYYTDVNLQTKRP